MLSPTTKRYNTRGGWLLIATNYQHRLSLMCLDAQLQINIHFDDFMIETAVTHDD